MIITDEELLALLESDVSQEPVFHPVSVYALDAVSHRAAKEAGLPAYASLHRTRPDASWQWEGLFAAGDGSVSAEECHLFQNEDALDTLLLRHNGRRETCTTRSNHNEIKAFIEFWRGTDVEI